MCDKKAELRDCKIPRRNLYLGIFQDLLHNEGVFLVASGNIKRYELKTPPAYSWTKNNLL